MPHRSQMLPSNIRDNIKYPESPGQGNNLSGLLQKYPEIPRNTRKYLRLKRYWKIPIFAHQNFFLVMLLPAAVVVYVGHYWEIGRHLHQGWLYNAMQCVQRCTMCTRLYNAMQCVQREMSGC